MFALPLRMNGWEIGVQVRLNKKKNPPAFIYKTLHFLTMTPAQQEPGDGTLIPEVRDVCVLYRSEAGAKIGISFQSTKFCTSESKGINKNWQCDHEITARMRHQDGGLPAPAYGRGVRRDEGPWTQDDIHRRAPFGKVRDMRKKGI